MDFEGTCLDFYGERGLVFECVGMSNSSGVMCNGQTDGSKQGLTRGRSSNAQFRKSNSEIPVSTSDCYDVSMQAFSCSFFPGRDHMLWACLLNL